jgi:hypothetical protein
MIRRVLMVTILSGHQPRYLNCLDELVIEGLVVERERQTRLQSQCNGISMGAVAELVGIEGGVVSGVINLESSDVGASDRRPRHEEHYHEA